MQRVEAQLTLSIVVPIYRNEENIPELLVRLDELSHRIGEPIEVVAVVDGSPDRSAELLSLSLPRCRFRSRLLVLSRNFGSFSAIRAGLEKGAGDRYAVMAADLQEPIDLIEEFATRLRDNEADVAIGVRSGREDSWSQRIGAQVYWWCYRRFVQGEMPRGGVDVFGCSRAARDALLRLDERNSSLVGLLMWMGYRRAEVPYVRQERRYGASAWTMRRKLRYLKDSIFAFSDLPIRLLSVAGVLGILSSIGLAVAVLVAKARGGIDVPGYTPTVLLVTFFGGLNSLGLGVLGEYLWRTFENSKRRPEFLVARDEEFAGEGSG